MQITSEFLGRVGRAAIPKVDAGILMGVALPQTGAKAAGRAPWRGVARLCAAMEDPRRPAPGLQAGGKESGLRALGIRGVA